MAKTLTYNLNGKLYDVNPCECGSLNLYFELVGVVLCRDCGKKHISDNVVESIVYWNGGKMVTCKHCCGEGRVPVYE